MTGAPVTFALANILLTRPAQPATDRYEFPPVFSGSGTPAVCEHTTRSLSAPGPFKGILGFFFFRDGRRQHYNI